MLDKLKSLFVVKEEVINKEESSVSNDGNKPSKEVEPSKSTSTLSSTSNTKGNVSQPILDKLLGIINQNNQSGFDYIEFKNSLKALEKMGLDEKTMYRSAFATAQTIGASVPHLIESVDYYKKILNKENTEFSNALLQQNNSKIAEKEKEIQGYKEMIAEKENQLNLLSQEIERHKQLIHSLSGKIESDKQQINKTKIDFEVTFDFIMLQLEDDRKKIKLYLE